MSTDEGPGGTPHPPAPGRRGRSPWLWVGAGCGLLLLLTFGGCAALFYVVGRQAGETARQPLTRQQVLRSLGGTPIYPGAQVDLPLSKRLRTVSETANKFTGLFSGGKAKTGIGVFRVPAPPDKVMGWYDARFEGWRKVEASRPLGAGEGTVTITDTRRYLRGDRQVLVQVGRAKGSDKGAYLILFVLSGLGRN